MEMQGVRRAAPQLGERICFSGLGLIEKSRKKLLREEGAVVVVSISIRSGIGERSPRSACSTAPLMPRRSRRWCAT